MTLSWILIARVPFHRKDFNWKKYRGAGLVSGKVDILWAELNERVEAVTSSHSTTGNILQCIYSVLVAKNHQRFRLRDLAQEFSITDMLQKILIIFTEQLYWRKFFCGCFRSLWLWLLIAVIKRCAELCVLQLYRITIFHQYFTICSSRRSHRMCSIKKSVLKNFAKFTEKHLCGSLFPNKIASFFNFKDIIKHKIDHKWNSNLVYKIKCSSSNQSLKYFCVRASDSLGLTYLIGRFIIEIWGFLTKCCLLSDCNAANFKSFTIVLKENNRIKAQLIGFYWYHLIDQFWIEVSICFFLELFD